MEVQVNSHQTNRVNMIESVLSYLALNKTYITESAGLTESMEKVQELIEAIWLKNAEKNGASTGKTAKKKNSGSALEKQTFKIAAGLFLWAKKNKDIEMKKFADLKVSQYEGLRDAEKISKAKAIFGASSGKDLLFAKIKPADIEKLNELANEHKNDIASVSIGASKRVAAGQTLDQMIDETMTILKEEFDKYMLQYSDDYPEFYKGYKSARVIWDKGGRQNHNETEVQSLVKVQAG
jgi:hypothetical protein